MSLITAAAATAGWLMLFVDWLLLLFILRLRRWHFDEFNVATILIKAVIVIVTYKAYTYGIVGVELEIVDFKLTLRFFGQKRDKNRRRYGSGRI